MDGGWREERNDDSVEAVLSETDGRCEAARAGWHALDSRVEIKLVRKKGMKAGRRRGGGGKVKTRSL